MQVAPDIHVEWVEDEAVILKPTTNEVHYLNPAAAFAYALIEEHGYEAALAELRSRFGEKPNLEEDVAALVNQLVAAGVLLDD